MYDFRFWFFCIDNNLNQGFEHTRNPLYHGAIKPQPLKQFLDLNKCLKVYQSQKANLSWGGELVEQQKATVKKPDNLSLGLWNSYKKPSSAEHVCNLGIQYYRKRGGRENFCGSTRASWPGPHRAANERDPASNNMEVQDQQRLFSNLYTCGWHMCTLAHEYNDTCHIHTGVNKI